MRDVDDEGVPNFVEFNKLEARGTLGSDIGVSEITLLTSMRKKTNRSER